jgi:hypothetical protein
MWLQKKGLERDAQGVIAEKHGLSCVSLGRLEVNLGLWLSTRLEDEFSPLTKSEIETTRTATTATTTHHRKHLIMPKISRTKEMIAMPEGFVPGPHHVICAKGKAAKEHQANRMLRSMVKSTIEEYSEAPKLERSFIVSRVLKQIRKEGGFVREIDGRWYDVSDRNAREKIGQLYRDALHTQFKSSTKAKASIRRERRHMRRSATSGSSSASSSNSSSGDSVSSTSHTAALTPPSPPRSIFPISEVAFNFPTVTPATSTYPKQEVQREFQEFEPLPLSQAMVVDFNDSIRSDDTSFDEAIEEMLQSSEIEVDLFEPLPLF